MKHQAYKCTLICFVILLYTLTFSGVTMADPLADLKKVGEAKLQVLFWDVYNSSLYSQTGEYQVEIFPQALKINYLRNIDAKDLIERTQDEWEKLGIEKAKFSPWITLLTDIFPDIKKGDTLLLKVSDTQQSEFFFNGQTIGQISDQAFGKSFLRIWLDENCSYPKVRKKLIGQNK
jgi:hypothetical protein